MRAQSRIRYDANMGWREEWQSAVRGRLRQLIAARAPQTEALVQALAQVQTFQKQRLTETYADFLADAHAKPAALFFLNELYCSAPDAIERDADVDRIVPMMSKLLPRVALDAIGNAVELDVLSADLDLAMAQQSVASGVVCSDMATYGTLYTAVNRRADRERQIVLVGQCGHLLAQAVRLPLIVPTLNMMQLPAKKAGLLRLHQFLFAGMTAFKKLHSAQAFVQTIQARETVLLERWLG